MKHRCSAQEMYSFLDRGERSARAAGRLRVCRPAGGATRVPWSGAQKLWYGGPCSTTSGPRRGASASFTNPDGAWGEQCRSDVEVIAYQGLLAALGVRGQLINGLGTPGDR